uniref:THAP-type domain-containing protein n=1 Tax=Sinocyclocheilus anshuiensis TaxID=1608454 RepID=A0A671M5T5_9TELE
MPGICCAVGCNNSRQRNPKLQYYSIPKELYRWNKWLALIKRDHWQPTSNSIVQSALCLRATICMFYELYEMKSCFGGKKG